ncbi:MAG: hypothetical protein WAR37_02865 [Candidatus Microsaccharimonas sp.]
MGINKKANLLLSTQTSSAFSRRSGFTIVETVLFLAISGALIIALIAGAGVTLSDQRYRDATQSFKALLQQQYSELGSVQNTRTNTWSCNSDALVTSGGDEEYRGQSECMLIGKYLRIQGKDITIYPVLAYEIDTTTIPPTDIEGLRTKYALNASTTEIEKDELDWQTEIAWAASGADYNAGGPTPRSLGILFIRSPDSGQVYTFTSDDIPAVDAVNQATFTQLLIAGNSVPGQAARTLCIKSGGLAVSGDRAVAIAAYASAPSAIEVRSNDLVGNPSQC